MVVTWAARQKGNREWQGKGRGGESNYYLKWERNEKGETSLNPGYTWEGEEEGAWRKLRRRAAGHKGNREWKRKRRRIKS